MTIPSVHLEQGATGGNVQMLHTALTRLGIQIPAEEAKRATFGPGTKQAVLLFQRQHAADGLKLTGTVDLATATLITELVARLPVPIPVPSPAPSPEPAPAPVPEPGPVAGPSGGTGEGPSSGRCTVHGTVRQADWTPLAGARVVAFDQRLAAPRAIGDGFTGPDGRYSIVYPTTGLDPHGQRTAYLFVRVFGRDGKVAVESDMLCKAPCEATIDLVVGGGSYPGPSEFETMLAVVTPELHDAALAGLTREQVAFLSCLTGLDRQRLQYLVWAHKRGREQEVPPVALYGYAREGLPTALQALFGQTPQVRRLALERALADNIVPLAVRASLDEIERRMIAAAARFLQAPPDQPASATVTPLLNSAGLSPAEQRTFLTHHLASQGSSEALWQAVAADPTLAPKAPRIQLAIQVAAITRNHGPMIDALMQTGTQGAITKVRDLARIPPAAWQTLVERTGVPDDTPGEDRASKATRYVGIIVRTLEVLFPSAVFAARLKTDAQAPNRALSRFFDRNPDFELRETHVDRYLGNNPRALDGVAQSDDLVRSLKQVQRVLRLTPRYDDVQRLMGDGLDSAHRIVSRGRAQFLAAHGEALGSDRAQDIYDRARQVAATAALLFARHSPQMNSIGLAILPNPAGNGA